MTSRPEGRAALGARHALRAAPPAGRSAHALPARARRGGAGRGGAAQVASAARGSSGSARRRGRARTGLPEPRFSAMAAYRLVLVRHGESAWNLENRFSGWYDADLSPAGQQEARRGGEALRGTADC